MLPSGAYGLQARQEARDFRRDVRESVPCRECCGIARVRASNQGRKSDGLPALAAKLRACRVSSSSLRASPSASGTPSSGKVRRRRLESMTLAFSSPDVCCIALTLHSAHLFRGRAERRDCVLRAAGHRLAQRNRCVALRSKLCRALMLQGLRFLRYGGGISADCDEPDGLVSVAGYNPAASTPSPKSLPPARPARAEVVGAVPLFVVQCKSRSLRYLSLQPFPVRLLSRLSACLLNFSGHPPSRLAPSRRLSAKVRAIVLNVRLGMVAGGSVLARSEGCLGVNICNREQRTAIAAAAGFLREIVAILLTDTSLL